MSRRFALMAAALSFCGHALADVELVGFASLPADSFAGGPPTGAGISANGRIGPFPQQPVQGFSGVQFSQDSAGRLLFLSDNGFGSKANSADYRLRIYQVLPNFRTATGGDGSVMVERYIELSDPDALVIFPIVNAASRRRLLTGSDFDIESFVVESNGDIWIGDEYGPFLLHFDASGRLQEAPIRTPELNDLGEISNARELRSSDNPRLILPSDANLGRSEGFEGMAYTHNHDTLYPLLEGSVAGDPADARRIYNFDVKRRAFTGLAGYYRTADPSHAIGDFTPINNQEFLVIERDNGEGAAAQFKKIFRIDITQIDQNGYVAKEEVVDLLNITDPNDLNRDGSLDFDFPFFTIENVLVLSDETILVANDNNYPSSVGRGPDIDNNEIIILQLDQKLRFETALLAE